MIIQVAVVENESVFVEQLKGALGQWRQENGCKYELDISVYAKGEDLLERMPCIYDIIFIDIVLDGQIDGIQLAKELRKRNYRSSLVFLTSYESFVFEGYQVEALDYILKPIALGKVFRCMDRAAQGVRQSVYIYKNKGVIKAIPHDEIIYIQSENHYVDIITQEGIYKQLAALKDVMKRLPGQFRQCHRSMVLNIRHISLIKGSEVRMTNGSVLPVSATYLSEIRDAFVQQFVI